MTKHNRDGGLRDGGWTPSIDPGARPLYSAIADAMAADVTAGRLNTGDRLPPQRVLAQRLKCDFTTITKAYGEAERRGLTYARVGQGTFIRDPALREPIVAASLIDMSMNSPPRFDQPALADRMWRGVERVRGKAGVDVFLRYSTPQGAAEARAAAVRWLSPRLPYVSAGHITVCPGAQSVLFALFSVLTRPGDAVCTAALTYPGLRALAAFAGVRLQAIAMDDDGLDPDALDAACRMHKPAAIYVNPTLHNPTTSTMSLARRRAIIAVARTHGVRIIEDDAYGVLPSRSPPPFAALAPDITLHISSLSKCVSPSLRIAYLVTTDQTLADQVEVTLRATVLSASPFTAAIATRWIEDGTAGAVLAEIRAESAARQQLAANILPAVLFRADPEGFHLWLSLPAPWTRDTFAAQLRAQGVGVVASDAFSVASPPPEAVRIGLGATIDRDETSRALECIRDTLSRTPSPPPAII
jgi:DNA-binding transcriptional MocR family regulator